MSYCPSCADLLRERDRLRAEVERLRGALEWIAVEHANYHCGERAHAALDGERSSASPNRGGGDRG